MHIGYGSLGYTYKEAACPPSRLPTNQDLEPSVCMLLAVWRWSLVILSSCKKAPTDIFSPFCFLGAMSKCQPSSQRNLPSSTASSEDRHSQGLARHTHDCGLGLVERAQTACAGTLKLSAQRFNNETCVKSRVASIDGSYVGCARRGSILAGSGRMESRNLSVATKMLGHCRYAFRCQGFGEVTERTVLLPLHVTSQRSPVKL